jgi:hypothetical protein
MKLTVKGLRAKQTTGDIRFYWEPNSIERKAGWTALPLGKDMVAAVKSAEARNAEILGWRAGGAKPRAVARFTAPQTFGAILQRYRNEHLATKAPSTIKVNRAPLDRLEAWAGDQPMRFVTRARIRVLRDNLVASIGHWPAFKTLKAGREACAWALRQELVDANPFVEFDLAEPEARHQLFEPEDIALIEESAKALGLDGIGFAVELAASIGQREADILKLTGGRWVEVAGLEPALFDQLVHYDGPNAGKVMGITVRQGKGQRWVGVPVTGALRRRIEGVIAANANRRGSGIAVAQLVVNSRTGLPYQQRHFIRDFTAVRDHAIAAARSAHLVDQGERLAGLQFRDLRRTCVVRLGELGLEAQLVSGVTGHKLKTVEKILEVYMPRTTKMAARAIVARDGQTSAVGQVSEFRREGIRNGANAPTK